MTSKAQREELTWLIVIWDIVVVRLLSPVKNSKKMTGSRCVVQDCSNRSKHAAGISLHRSPAIKSEREKWVRFVRTHRANFNPSGTFVVCSDHFSEDCFERTMHVEGTRRRLIPYSVPTVFKKGTEKPSSARSRRKVSPLVCLLSVYSNYICIRAHCN